MLDSEEQILVRKQHEQKKRMQKTGNIRQKTNLLVTKLQDKFGIKFNLKSCILNCLQTSMLFS